MRAVLISLVPGVLAILLWPGQDGAAALMPPDTARTIGGRVSFDGFVDEAGKPLDDGGGRPWIVSPIYTRCPHTCSAITGGLRKALETSGLATSEYRVVSFSFDPSETSESLEAFRSRMRLSSDWTTLRAIDETSLVRLLDTLDFRTMQTDDGEYQHPNLVAVLSPDRKLAGYVFGVNPSASELVRVVRGARAGVPATARWGTLLFFFAAVGFLVSTFVFFWLLAERRSRIATAQQS